MIHKPESKKHSFQCIMNAFMLAASLSIIGTSTLAVTPWVEKHNVTASQLQQAFNFYTQSPYSFRPSSVCGWFDAGEARYASLWEPSGPGLWASRTSLTASELDTWNNQYTSQGLHISSLDVYNQGGLERYNVIWTASSGTTSHLVKSITKDTLLGQNIDQAVNGFVITELDAENFSGVTRYTAVWKKLSDSSSALPVIKFLLTSSNLPTEVSSQAAAGRQLTALKGWDDGNGALWMARFESGKDTNRWFFYGVDRSRYETEILNSFYQGYRPVHLNVFKLGGTPVYSAIYERNGGYPAGRLQSFNDAVDQFVQTKNMAGLSVAIMYGEKLVYAKGFGLADKASSLYMHPDHRFRIASVSKTITALAAAALEESNYFGADLVPFDMDRGVAGADGSFFGRSLPGNPAYVFTDCDKAMTLRHLLNHTSGWWRGPNTVPAPVYSSSNVCAFGPPDSLPSLLSVDNVVRDQLYETNQIGVMTDAFTSRPRSFIPGMEYNYTNANYAIAARVIEQFLGTDYESAVSNLVLKPCGVKAMNIGWQQQAKRLPNEVTYYESTPGVDPYVNYDVRAGDGAGGWVTSPKDLLLIARRMDLLQGKPDIISATQINSTMRAWLPAADAGGYGMGWALNSQRRLEGHNGAGPGVASFLARFVSGSPIEGFKLAFVTNEGQNANDSTKGASAWTIIDALIPLIAAHLNTPSEIPTQDLFWQENDAYDNLRLSLLGLSTSSLSISDLGYVGAFTSVDADFDHDGRPALMEHYLGTSDYAADNGSVLALEFNGNYVRLKWQAARSTGIQVGMESSTDLQNWTALPATAIQLDPTQGGISTDPYQVQVSRSSLPTFYRLRLYPR
jgi:hypothetical protein